MMRLTLRYIDRWMLLLVVVLLTACRSSDEDSSDQNCYLDIYVYAPDRPVVTRGDVGEISPLDEKEKKVNTLKIWVFKSGNGEKVGYMAANPTYLNESTGHEMYRMQVAKEFAENPEAVDVYVVANEGSYGLTLTENSTRDVLEAAQIGTYYFGTTSLVSSVPEGGLPMSAVQKNQPIYGSFPSLRIGTKDQMTILQLTRAVSKLRFVLCRVTELETSAKTLESIVDISLGENQIPESSWLVPKEVCNYTYNHSAISYGSVSKDIIPEVDDPLVYAYETQSAQAYESLINHASDEESSRKEANLAWLQQYGTENNVTQLSSLTEDGIPQLKQIGLTYLRESDKQLTGSITYRYKEGETITQKTVPFSMAAPGDFLRNHSWIVYIYFIGTEIHVHIVTRIGMKTWAYDENEDQPESIYNW